MVHILRRALLLNRQLLWEDGKTIRTCNIAGVAAGTVQLSISAGNAVLPGSNMIVTSTAAGDAFNVAKTMLLGTGCGMYDVIRIVNTGTAALTVSPGANLIVRKLS